MAEPVFFWKGKWQILINATLSGCAHGGGGVAELGGGGWLPVLFLLLRFPWLGSRPAVVPPSRRFNVAQPILAFALPASQRSLFRLQSHSWRFPAAPSPSSIWDLLFLYLLLSLCQAACRVQPPPPCRSIPTWPASNAFSENYLSSYE